MFLLLYEVILFNIALLISGIRSNSSLQVVGSNRAPTSATITRDPNEEDSNFSGK